MSNDNAKEPFWQKLHDQLLAEQIANLRAVAEWVIEPPYRERITPQGTVHIPVPPAIRGDSIVIPKFFEHTHRSSNTRFDRKFIGNEQQPNMALVCWLKPEFLEGNHIQKLYNFCQTLSDLYDIKPLEYRFYTPPADKIKNGRETALVLATTPNQMQVLNNVLARIRTEKQIAEVLRQDIPHDIRRPSWQNNLNLTPRSGRKLARHDVLRHTDADSVWIADIGEGMATIDFTPDTVETPSVDKLHLNLDFNGKDVQKYPGTTGIAVFMRPGLFSHPAMGGSQYKADASPLLDTFIHTLEAKHGIPLHYELVPIAERSPSPMTAEPENDVAVLLVMTTKEHESQLVWDIYGDIVDSIYAAHEHASPTTPSNRQR